MAPRAAKAKSASRLAAKSNSAFKTISEVAGELGVPQHVLRFWETKFPHIKPLKRSGGRRYYRPEDVALLHRIRGLLYDDGYTIKGVQKLLRQNRKAAPKSKPEAAEPAAEGGLDAAMRTELEAVLAELEDLRNQLRTSA